MLAFHVKGVWLGLPIYLIPVVVCEKTARVSFGGDFLALRGRCRPLCGVHLLLPNVGGETLEEE